MEDQNLIREKALRLAVRTGLAPDLEFVWDTQRQEGTGECFGSIRPSCPSNCRWRQRCRLLSNELIDSPWLGQC